jgi:hypothetical protein
LKFSIQAKIVWGLGEGLKDGAGSAKTIYYTFEMCNYLVSDLYTWIRTTPSRMQPLPGVQKLIFDAKFGFSTPKKIII